MKKSEDRNNSNLVLFPHSHIGEQDLNRILPIFGPLTIFQPWFMAPPDFMSQKDYQGAVIVLNPPSNANPGEDFRGLLSEYKTWIQHNRDKSNAAFIKLRQYREFKEESSWEIRKALLRSTDDHAELDRPSGDLQNVDESKLLKWHLVLHLARDIEEERQEADRMLRGLKDVKSPIEDLLGEGAVKNPLTDLSQFDSQPESMSYPLDQVFDAWFGLFGQYLKGGDALFTVSRQVMDYASELWDVSMKETGGEPMPQIQLKYPDLCDRWKRGELGNPITDLGKGYQNDITRLKEHSKEVEAVFQKELMEKPLQVAVKCFSPFSNQSDSEDNETLDNLSGRILILIE